MDAHDLLNVFRSLAGVVEWDGRDEMVADVGTNDVVEEMGIEKSEITIDRCRGTTSKVPGAVIVVRHGSVGVLEEGNGDCKCQLYPSKILADNLPIQLFTQSHGTPQRTRT